MRSNQACNVRYEEDALYGISKIHKLVYHFRAAGETHITNLNCPQQTQKQANVIVQPQKREGRGEEQETKKQSNNNPKFNEKMRKKS